MIAAYQRNSFQNDAFQIEPEPRGVEDFSDPLEQWSKPTQNYLIQLRTGGGYKSNGGLVKYLGFITNPFNLVSRSFRFGKTKNSPIPLHLLIS